MGKIYCITRCGFGEKPPKRVPLHSFPSAEHLVKIWREAIAKENGTSQIKGKYLCSCHFIPGDYLGPSRLSPLAIPTVFPGMELDMDMHITNSKPLMDEDILEDVQLPIPENQPDEMFEIPAWDNNGDPKLLFEFKQNKKLTKKVSKSTKTQQTQQNYNKAVKKAQENSFEPGKFVKLNKSSNVQQPNKNNVNKRKAQTVNNNNNNPNKKRKYENVQSDVLNEVSGKKNGNKIQSKKVKFNKQNTDTQSSPPPPPPLLSSSSSSSSFRDQLVDNLKGSRFRFLNEQLYSTKSSDAVKLFKQDREAFNAYHDGYRQQVEHWPLNPLDRIIKSVKKLPKNLIIADFGCGEGRLAKSVIQKTYSLDLVAKREDIIACDMANTPLATNSVDVAIYCLSLMGTNLKDFLLEANRVLKINGHLKIAEVVSRITNVREFVEHIKRCGFQLVNQDLSNNLFIFLNFKKLQNIDKSNKKILPFSLKPCLYKKR